MLRRFLKAIRDRVGRTVLLRSAPLYAAGLNRFVTGNQAYETFSRHGFHLLRKHFYLPIPDETDLNDPMLKDASDLVGIDMNESAALEFLNDIFPKYQTEFRSAFPLHRQDGSNGFYLVNGGFMAGDAHACYTFIRHGRPKRIVGGGGGKPA